MFCWKPILNSPNRRHNKCYIRERESWALEFYVNFTVVESDGMQKDHYTKMCVLFDS